MVDFGFGQVKQKSTQLQRYVNWYLLACRYNGLLKEAAGWMLDMCLQQLR